LLTSCPGSADYPQIHRSIVYGSCSWSDLYSLAITGVVDGVTTEGQPYPERAIEYIKEHGHTERIFNDYSWGGYLIFHDLQPFVDGRADMYVLSGTSVYQDYLQLKYGSYINPLQVLDNYRVEVVLIPPDSSLRWALEHAPNWRKAYFSYPAVVFVRE
jgi:hypothetical protein